MAERLFRTFLARADLIDIWQYIAQDNETAADRFLNRIEQALLMLRDNPRAGRARNELAKGMRSFPVGNYVLFYRSGHDGIELVRVLNGYLDLQHDVLDKT